MQDLEVTRVSTPYKYKASDRRVKPVELLVIHYTASPYSAKHGGSNSKRITNWMKGLGRESSTHFTVLRDGAIIQAAGLDERTWHAGGSRLVRQDGSELKGINFRSIGLDFDNVGMLYKTPEGWVDSYGYSAYKKGKKFSLYQGPEPFVEVDEKGKESYWEPYSPESVAAMQRLIYHISSHIPELVETPDCIVGHSDIKSTKSDPGPACPMGELRKAVSGFFNPESLTLD